MSRTICMPKSAFWFRSGSISLPVVHALVVGIFNVGVLWSIFNFDHKPLESQNKRQDKTMNRLSLMSLQIHQDFIVVVQLFRMMMNFMATVPPCLANLEP